MSDQNLFKRLKLAGWRQFASVDIEFHHQLTVITGANGAGKSTLLNILASQLGVSRPFLSTPRWSTEGKIIYWAGAFTKNVFDLFRGFLKLGDTSWAADTNQVGQLEYTDGQVADLNSPKKVGNSFNLEVSNGRTIPGIVIGSHRPIPNYQPLPNIPFQGINPEEVFGTIINESNARYSGGGHGASLLYQMKYAMAVWAIIGEGNSKLPPNRAQQEAYDGFIEVLRKTLPESLGFIGLSVRAPDVVMETRTGEFLIDAASGGIATIIEVAALLYACSIRRDLKGKKFVVAFDEPENHLHPSLQRTLFPKLVSAFPQVQFIVSTHSPFVVSSLKDSHVYVLSYQKLPDDKETTQIDSSRVVSQKLNYADRAGTASEILREVLGIPTTLPLWVESSIEEISSKYSGKTLNETTARELRDELELAGLREHFPEALAAIARRND